MSKIELLNDETMNSVVGGSGTLSTAQFNQFILKIAEYFGVLTSNILIDSKLIYTVVYVKGVNFKVDLYSVAVLGSGGVAKTYTKFQLTKNGPFVSPYVIHSYVK